MIDLRVIRDGEPVPGVKGFSWSETNHFNPDTFQATFAMDPEHGVEWWDGSDLPLILELQINDGRGWHSLGVGVVDTVEVDPLARVAQVSGRDLAALLQEGGEPPKTYQNMTATQIVLAVAEAHGLLANVTEIGTTTGTSAASDGRRDRDAYEGRFFRETHTREVLPQNVGAANDWDLLVRLAQVHQFSLYMAGRTIHFHPLPKLTDKPIVRRWRRGTVPEADMIGLRQTRRMQMARAVTVNVSSFNSATGQTVKATAKTTVAKSGGNVAGSVFRTKSGRPKVYDFNKPNLTKQQAQEFADAMLADITRHERHIRWSEPFTREMGTRRVLRVEGTGSAFDQVYFIETVTVSAGFEEGARLDVTATSHSAGVTFGGA